MPPKHPDLRQSAHLVLLPTSLSASIRSIMGLSLPPARPALTRPTAVLAPLLLRYPVHVVYPDRSQLPGRYHPVHCALGYLELFCELSRPVSPLNIRHLSGSFLKTLSNPNHSADVVYPARHCLTQNSAKLSDINI